VSSVGAPRRRRCPLARRARARRDVGRGTARGGAEGEREESVRFFESGAPLPFLGLGSPSPRRRRAFSSLPPSRLTSFRRFAVSTLTFYQGGHCDPPRLSVTSSFRLTAFSTPGNPWSPPLTQPRIQSPNRLTPIGQKVGRPVMGLRVRGGGRGRRIYSRGSFFRLPQSSVVVAPLLRDSTISRPMSERFATAATFAKTVKS
jgi:hypothetical protein